MSQWNDVGKNSKDISTHQSKKIFHWEIYFTIQKLPVPHKAHLLWKEANGLKVEYRLFSTYYDKCVCDGIGQKVKREPTNARLRATDENQSFTTKEWYMWATKRIDGITMFSY